MEYFFTAFLEKDLRVDMYLSILFPEYSRSYIQKMIDKWQLEINNKIVTKNIKIKNKDEINLKIITKDYSRVLPEEQDLDIIYEDDNIIVINKNSDVNVHPVPGDLWNTNTLVNWILYHCREKLPCISWIHRPWIVHRLDKDTSWIILIAKNDNMMSYLSSIIKDREITKNYIAIVDWIVKDKEFKIESYIWRDQNDRKKMSVKNPINPKLALSFWEVIWYIDWKYTILKINIKTWRTHQIRVHLSSIWYPIIWDKVYWNKKTNEEVKEKYGLERQALHAFELKFLLYSKKVNFIAPLKEDMKKIIWNDILNNILWNKN